jgi:hypothetical protein
LFLLLREDRAAFGSLVDIGGDANCAKVRVTDSNCSLLFTTLLLVNGKDTHNCASGTGNDSVGKVSVGRDKDVAGQFTHRDLVRGFLELENLLVDELTFFVVDNVGIEGTLLAWRLVTRLLGASATPRKSQARETTIDVDVFAITAALADGVN